MEWTRELRYKPYDDWGAKTLLDLKRRLQAQITN